MALLARRYSARSHARASMSVCTDTTPHICVIQYMNFCGEYEAEALSAAGSMPGCFHICVNGIAYLIKNVIINLLCLIAMPNTSAACVLLSAAAELLTK